MLLTPALQHAPPAPHLFQDVGSDNSVQVGLHVLEDQVNVTVIVRPQDVQQPASRHGRGRARQPGAQIPHHQGGRIHEGCMQCRIKCSHCVRAPPASSAKLCCWWWRRRRRRCPSAAAPPLHPHATSPDDVVVVVQVLQEHDLPERALRGTPVPPAVSAQLPRAMAPSGPVLGSCPAARAAGPAASGHPRRLHAPGRPWHSGRHRRSSSMRLRFDCACQWLCTPLHRLQSRGGGSGCRGGGVAGGRAPCSSIRGRAGPWSRAAASGPCWRVEPRTCCPTQSGALCRVCRPGRGVAGVLTPWAPWVWRPRVRAHAPAMCMRLASC